jgi:HAE1 family hydrophobic/amphiphilic exporter-1
LAGGYASLTRRLARVALLVLAVYGGLIVLTGWQFQRTPTGFIPEQDQGYFISVLQLPPGASLDRTDAAVRKWVKAALEVEGVIHGVAFPGFNGATSTNAPDSGSVFLTLAPFEERIEKGIEFEKILADLQAKAGIRRRGAGPRAQPAAGARHRHGGGFKMMIQDRRGRGLPALDEAVQAVAAAARQTPEVRGVFSLFNTRTPAGLRRHRPGQGGDAGRAGGARIPDAGRLPGLVLRQRLQLPGPDLPGAGPGRRRLPPERARYCPAQDPQRRRRDGPIGSIATFRDESGPYRVPRYNLYPAAELQGAAAPGFSSGEAIAAMERIAGEVLPDGMSFEWTELAYQETRSGNTAIYVFAASVLFVFLMLAALYESWLLPLAVILIVPMCLLAAVTGVLLPRARQQHPGPGRLHRPDRPRRQERDPHRRVREGGRGERMSRLDAAVEAARVRLRPILMTSFAFILGVVPLVIAEGPGAEMRQALGTAVFAGMLGVTLFGLLFTPVFYVVARWLGTRGRRGKAAEPAAAPGVAAPQARSSGGRSDHRPINPDGCVMMMLRTLAASVILAVTSAAVAAEVRVEAYTVPEGAGPHDVAPAPGREGLAQGVGCWRAGHPRSGHALSAPGPAGRGLGAAWRDRGPGRGRRRPDDGRGERWPLPEDAGHANLNMATFDGRSTFW